MILLKPHFLEKFYDLKCSQPIRLDGSLIIKISRSHQSNFLDCAIHQRKVVAEATSFGWVCSAVPQTAEFFDHQYLWKKYRNLLGFLHGNSHQAKVAPGTTSFSWVWPAVPVVQLDRRIL